MSGDNTSLEAVRDVAARLGRIEVALLNAGAAQLPYIGDGHLTLTAAETLEAARILSARTVIPLHYEGWAHYTEGRSELEEAFAGTDVEGALELPKRNQG